CSPAWNGPTCSTSMCRSISPLLSMPSDRQACENAQVEQKCSSSPSSASVRVSCRGNAVGFTGFSMQPSDHAREAGRGGLVVGRLVEVMVEAHGNVTQQQPSARGRDDPVGFDPDQPVVH